MNNTSIVEQLGSVESIWHEALRTPPFSLPSAEFIRKLEAHCDGTMSEFGLDTVSTNLLRPAIQTLAFNLDAGLAERLSRPLVRNSDALVARATDQSAGALAPLVVALHVAIAQGVMDGSAPAREPLIALARYGIALSKTQTRNRNHPSVLQQFRLAAYAALLAQDLDLLLAVVDLRKQAADFPRQWTLLQDLARNGRLETGSGSSFIRCDDSTLRSAFVSLFSAHRPPKLAQVEPMLAGDAWFGGPLIGNYVYTWIWLQTFAPDPTTKSDWPTLRELMIG